jgi:cobalamin biosynthesis protein CobT
MYISNAIKLLFFTAAVGASATTPRLRKGSAASATSARLRRLKEDKNDSSVQTAKDDSNTMKNDKDGGETTTIDDKNASGENAGKDKGKGKNGSAADGAGKGKDKNEMKDEETAEAETDAAEDADAEAQTESAAGKESAVSGSDWTYYIPTYSPTYYIPTYSPSYVPTNEEPTKQPNIIFISLVSFALEYTL